MKLLTGTTLFCALAVFTLAEKVRYDGHKVLNIFPRTAKDVQDILNMEEEFQLDFWRFPKYVDDSFQVRVGPNVLRTFMSKLRDMEIDFNVWIDDVQRQVDSEDQQLRKRRAAGWTPDPLNEYLTMDQITAYIENKYLEHENMELSYLPYYTSEGNLIPVVKIKSLIEEKEADKSIFIDCGIHAREWISPAFCLFVIDQLLLDDPASAELLDMYNWHIVPVLNPDGYRYSHTNDRYWRKNRRSPPDQRNCYGVDLNRNFGYMYNPG